MRLSNESRGARFSGMTGSGESMTKAGQGEARWPPPSPISRAFVPPCSTIAARLETAPDGAGLLSDQSFSRTGTLAPLRCGCSAPLVGQPSEKYANAAFQPLQRMARCSAQPIRVLVDDR